jgi:hypothetical protein
LQKHFSLCQNRDGQRKCFSAFQYVRKSHLKEKKNIGSIYLFGFCGVTNRTRIADIVLYRSLVSEKKGLVFKEKLFYPQNVIESIKKIKKITGADIHFLHAASVSDIVSTDANKKEIEEKSKATAFDMESFFLVEAAKAGIFPCDYYQEHIGQYGRPHPFSTCKDQRQKAMGVFLYVYQVVFCL